MEEDKEKNKNTDPHELTNRVMPFHDNSCYAALQWSCTVVLLVAWLELSALLRMGGASDQSVVTPQELTNKFILHCLFPQCRWSFFFWGGGGYQDFVSSFYKYVFSLIVSGTITPQISSCRWKPALRWQHKCIKWAIGSLKPWIDQRPVRMGDFGIIFFPTF